MPGFLIALTCGSAAIFMRALCRLGNMWLYDQDLERRPRFAYGMHGLSWFLMLLINALSLWYAVGSGRCLGEDESEGIVTLWAIAVGLGWLVIEPVQVAFLVLAPILLVRGHGCGGAFEKVHKWMERCGIDGAFVTSLFL